MLTRIGSLSYIGLLSQSLAVASACKVKSNNTPASKSDPSGAAVLTVQSNILKYLCFNVLGVC
jgi:hypothetical protein